MEENAGWERRLAGRAAAGGLVGGAAGTWLAVARRTPLGATAGATACNATLAAVLYGAVVEALRVATCQDGPLNSVVAGGLAGYALGLAQHGPGRGPRAGSVFFAIAGGMCHAADARGISVGRAAEAALRAVSLLDGPTGGTDDANAANGVAPWYERWLPIRKLDAAEYDNHRQQAELKNAYGTGQLDPEEYRARMAQLQMEAFMRKRSRVEGED